MGAALVWVVGLAGALLLVLAGVGHVRHRRLLQAVLAVQRLLPHQAHRPVALIHGPLEIVLGAGALVSWTLGWAAATAFMASVGALYVVFTVNLLLVWRLRPSAPCGCFGGDEPAGPATISRAAVLGGCALVAAMTGLPERSAMQLLLHLGAAALIAGVAWLAPALAGLRSHRPPMPH